MECVESRGLEERPILFEVERNCELREHLYKE